MKRFLTFRSCLLVIFAIILFAGMGFVGSTTLGGPYWAYLYGNTILGGLLALVGLSILIAIVIRPSSLVELRRSNSKPGKVTFIEIAYWFVVALGMVLVGAMCFLGHLGALLTNR